MGKTHSKISYKTLRESLQNGELVKTGVCYVQTSSSVSQDSGTFNGILTSERYAILVKHIPNDKGLPFYSLSHFCSEKFDEILGALSYQKQETDSLDDIKKKLSSAETLDGLIGESFLFCNETVVDATKDFSVIKGGSTSKKWGSPIKLQKVVHFEKKLSLKKKYFRVKQCTIEGSIKDQLGWDDELKKKHEDWNQAFLTACKNSPDKEVVHAHALILRPENPSDNVTFNTTKKTHKSPTRVQYKFSRRLTCEASQSDDNVLELLALLLSVLFLLYWFVLRRIYNPAGTSQLLRNHKGFPRQNVSSTL